MKLIIIYMLLSFILSYTIGAFLSFIISLVIFYRRSIYKNVATFSLALFISLVIVLFIRYSDLDIFVKIRGSYNVFTNIAKTTGINELADVDYNTAMLYTDDSSQTSFLFRIKQWSRIFADMKNFNTADFFIGKGFGLLPANFGHVAHNDYLGIFYSGGFILLIIIYYPLLKGINKLKNSFYLVPLISFLVYSFNENLYTSGLPTLLIFYFFGWILHSDYLEIDVFDNPANRQIMINQTA